MKTFNALGEITKSGSLLGLLAATTFLACGSVDGAGEAGETPEVANTTEDPLVGVVTPSACDSREQQFAINALNLGRFVVYSEAFRSCVRAAITGTVAGHNFGGAVTLGEYIPQSGDPFRGSSVDVMTDQIMYAARSTSNVRLKCGTNTEWVAEAYVGSYDSGRADDESLEVGWKWRQFALDDDGATTTNAQFFRDSRAAAANAIWHEGLHQWGYEHRGGDWGSDLETTMPYIVGGCMEEVARQSARCPFSCASGQRPVSSHAAVSCTCVDDPQFDVGIIPQRNSILSWFGVNSCPKLSGRGTSLLDDHLTITMDDENGGNANSHSGWLGFFSQSSDTTLRFCRAPGARFKPNSNKNYAVLQLGATCPPGSVKFNRYFDNEDFANQNSSTGHEPPNVLNANTNLRFCMFLSGSGPSATFPDLGTSYGVFAPPDVSGALESGTFHTDDEDSSNANRLEGSFMGSEQFLTPGSNTTFKVARVR